MENKQDWEKEFDERFDENLYLNKGMSEFGVEERYTNVTEEMKKFIKEQIEKAEERGAREFAEGFISYLGDKVFQDNNLKVSEGTNRKNLICFKTVEKHLYEFLKQREGEE